MDHAIPLETLPEAKNSSKTLILGKNVCGPSVPSQMTGFCGHLYSGKGWLGWVPVTIEGCISPMSSLPPRRTVKRLKSILRERPDLPRSAAITLRHLLIQLPHLREAFWHGVFLLHQSAAGHAEPCELLRAVKDLQRGVDPAVDIKKIAK